VIEIKKSSFNPLVFTTSGGMVPECTRVHKKRAEKIVEKRIEPYASVMTSGVCRKFYGRGLIQWHMVVSYIRD